MSTITLISKRGNLHTSRNDIVDELLRDYWGEDDPILIYHYPLGDVDTIDSETPNTVHLISALYDSREMGLIPASASIAILPGGVQLRF